MANTTTRVQSTTTPWGIDTIHRRPPDTAAIYYPGQMIAVVPATGRAAVCDDTAGLVFDGIAAKTVRLQIFTGDTTTDYDKQLLVERPFRFTMTIASANIATDLGKKVYAKFDNEVAFTTTNSIHVGWVDDVISSTVVLIRPAYAGQHGSAAFDGEELTFDGATGANVISVPDNLADALSISEGSNAYLTFDTTNAAERVLAKKQLRFIDGVKLAFGDADDLTATWDGTDLLVAQAAADSIIKWGVSGAGINHIFYGDTATCNATWDQTNDQLLFNDNTFLAIGTGAGSAGDIRFSWDATRMNVTQLTANSEIRWGIDGAGIDQRWYGDTASASMLWDQSADAVVFGGAAGITNLKVKQSTAVAITGATTLVLADSGGHFTVSQGAAYDVDLPSPTTGAGASYFFSVTAPGANNVTITVDGGAATFVGSIVTEGQIIVATGSSLTIASSVAVIGDSIEIRSLATNLYHVRAVSSILNGITIA